MQAHETEAFEHLLHDITCIATHTLDSFSTLTIEQTEKVIDAVQGKTCQLDPAPTWIVKGFSTLLSPFIARLFNESLASDCFPERYKLAIIRPLLKKTNMNASQLKSYRPVSNLSFLEQFILSGKHFSMPAAPCQWYYKKHNNTETALIKVYDDLLTATENGQMSALCLLDLTAAFDTVDHELLLARLERILDVRSRVFDWVKSYLIGRTYCAIYAGVSSSIKQVTCSVALLFLLYTADLADLAAKHGVTLYTFADDTQLYIHCEFHKMATSRDVLERCIQDIGHWMSANRLKLNPDKTELLWT